MLFRRLFAATLALLTLIATPVLAQSFPTLQSEDLNGRAVTLPADFPGDPTIVFIAYRRNQQPLVDSWVQTLGLDPEIGAQFVELPVVGRGAKLIKSTIDNGMRSGITATALRARTITIYQSVRTVNDALGFSGRNTIRALVIRQNGEVLYATSGPVTPEKAKALAAAYEGAG